MVAKYVCVSLLILFVTFQGYYIRDKMYTDITQLLYVLWYTGMLIYTVHKAWHDKYCNLEVASKDFKWLVELEYIYPSTKKYIKHISFQT